MERLVERYQKILSRDETAESRFFSLTKRVNKDSYSFLFSVEMRRSKLLINISGLLREGIINIDDLIGFSPGLCEKMKCFAM